MIGRRKADPDRRSPPPTSGPSSSGGRKAIPPARRPPSSLAGSRASCRPGWRLERAHRQRRRVSRRRPPLHPRRPRRPPHPGPRGQPQRNAAVEASHKLIPEECWRPAFATTCTSASPGSSATSSGTSTTTSERVHHGRLTRGRPPPTSSTGSQGECEMSRECRLISVTVHPRAKAALECG
jgi:hypothetical protein